MRLLLAVLIAVSLSALPACTGDEGAGEAPTGGDGSREATGEAEGDGGDGREEERGVPALTQTCEREDAPVLIRFPEGWSSNSGEVAAPCSFFHPEPFEVPPATETFDIAISIDIEPVPFDTVSEELGGPGSEIVSRTETRVAGADGLAVETEGTGEALLPEGMRSYAYYVDMGDERTLRASTHDAAGLDYPHNKRVLDAMMRELAFFSGG